MKHDINEVCDLKLKLYYEVVSLDIFSKYL